MTADRPTGPEDSTPGQEIHLTRDQYDELLHFVPHRHGAVRLRDRGANYVEAGLLDAEGNVTSSQVLYPLAAGMTPSGRRRWLRKVNAEIEADKQPQCE